MKNRFGIGKGLESRPQAVQQPLAIADCGPFDPAKQFLRQGDFKAGDHFGDAARDLDQAGRIVSN